MSNQSSSLLNLIQNAAGKPVFVIGKGPSLDELELERLPDGLVINLNDSERIHAGTLGIFSGGWVRAGLSESGYRCRHYLAGQPLPASVSHDLLAPPPAEMAHAELNTLRLEQETIYDEPLVLLNAIKVALMAYRESRHPQDVYFLGFDFSIQDGSASSKAGADYSGVDLLERDAIISSQESDFRQLLHYFDDGHRLRIHHVGEKTYSSISPIRFNRELCGSGQSEDTSRNDLANPNRVLIVAEFTNNHLGDPKRLVEMVERAKEAGADLIKVQKRDVDTFYTSEQLKSYYWSPFGETLADYRHGVELTDELLDLLDETCRKVGIEWFCSVLDFPSYLALERFQPRLIKIPSTISNHRHYHQQIAEVYHGAVVVSTGLTESEYLDHVLETYRDNPIIYLLHCVSAYPTPHQYCNVGVVREYEHQRRTRDKRIVPGYSSHDIGSEGCILAVAAGARMIEKHVKLGDVDWVHFDKVALDLKGSEFSDFVKNIRRSEEIVGTGEKRILDCEHHKYSVVN